MRTNQPNRSSMFSMLATLYLFILQSAVSTSAFTLLHITTATTGGTHSPRKFTQQWLVADATEESHRTRPPGKPPRTFLPTLERDKSKIQQVTTIEDYKRVVAEETDRMVCVKFFAPWCRACQAMAPEFRRLAYLYPSVKFVQVPLTKENGYLYEGLGVPSLPFGHLYHPDTGLVEERKINKKVFAQFANAVQCYVDGYCPLEWQEDCYS